MSTENTLNAPAQSGGSVENTSANVSTPAVETTAQPAAQAATPAAPQGIMEKIATAQKAMDAKKDGGLPEATTLEKPAVKAPVAPAYQPNFKYKAALQEKELDPFFHSLIKDAESEKKVKDVFTRADAFEYMKEKLTKRETDYESLFHDFSNQAKVVDKVMTAKQAGDLDSVFRNIGINDHQVIQWAAKRVDYLQMMNGLPPEQRAALERQQQQALATDQFQEQISQLTTERQALAAQTRTMQLDNVLSRPEISQSAAFWDQKMGQPGAFREMVIEEARAHYFSTQQLGQAVDLSPEQAVAHVMKKFGGFISVQQAGAPQAPQAPQQNAAPAPQAPAEKPVIPAVNGGSKTPIRKQALSLDDIKQRAAELKKQQAAQI